MDDWQIDVFLRRTCRWLEVVNSAGRPDREDPARMPGRSPAGRGLPTQLYQLLQLLILIGAVNAGVLYRR
jgi:hypothetical protein